MRFNYKRGMIVLEFLRIPSPVIQIVIYISKIYNSKK